MVTFQTDIPPDLSRIETIGFFDRSKYGLGTGLCVRFYERVGMDSLIPLSPQSLKLLRLLELNGSMLREQSGLSLEDFFAEILRAVKAGGEPEHGSTNESAK